MGFQEITPIHTGEQYLDIAIRRANKKTSQKKVQGPRIEKIKTLELTKVAIVRDILDSRLKGIMKEFPKISDLTPFYQKLVEYTIGKDKLKIELSKIKLTKTKISDVFKRDNQKLKKTNNLKNIHAIKNGFYGRAASLLKNIDYKFLQQTRKILQSFPTIKSKYKQIAIAGFPNVGKSTLLAKLTGSKPEIAAYAFTTKEIRVGYLNDLQLLDTPGTLNRFNKMNAIEQQAYLVMKLVAKEIIYIFDLTEPYPLKDQIRLYERLKELNKPVIVYLSKTDILDKKKIDEFKKKYEVIDFNKLKKNLI